MKIIVIAIFGTALFLNIHPTLAASFVAVPQGLPEIAVTPQMEKAVADGIKNDLKDPDSARFYALRAFNNNDGTIAVFGLMNAKNSYGGYTGKLPFSIIVLQAKSSADGRNALFAHGGRFAEDSEAGLSRFYQTHPGCAE